ncbi:hypothetical protein [Georgenia muralis]
MVQFALVLLFGVASLLTAPGAQAHDTLVPVSPDQDFTSPLAVDDTGRQPGVRTEVAPEVIPEPSGLTSQPDPTPPPGPSTSAQDEASTDWMPPWTTILGVQAAILVLAVAAALAYRRWRSGR